MAQRTTKRVQLDDLDWFDESEAVQAALQQILQVVNSPIIRACLEEAHEDIAHLTSAGEAQEEQPIAVPA
jgi:hypothetical protein